jgi:P-type Mg2+ transporter
MRHCNVAGRETEKVLLDGYLISHFQTGLKNLLDRAILDSPIFTTALLRNTGSSTNSRSTSRAA